MRHFSILILAATSAILASCGSEPAEPPVEQIVVREPGEAAKVAAAGNAAAPADDLVAAGKAAFAACTACHSVIKDGPSGAGPNLHGVAGRKAGALDGFRYSEAMIAYGAAWDDAELDGFLTDPSAKIPGTSMATGMVRDAEKRKAIIAYLKSLS